MNLARSGVRGVAVLVLALAACNQNTAETQAPDTAPAPVVEAEQPAATPAEPAPAPIPTLTELPVSSVDSVMLSRPQDAPGAMIIRVLGTAASNGWSLRNSSHVEETATLDVPTRSSRPLPKRATT